MSADIMLIKTIDGSLRPATRDDIDAVAALPLDVPLGATIRTLRNGGFHRKLFALLGYLYDNLPRARAEHNGEPIEQSFDRFREELVILSGHYETDVTRRGEVRLRAHSLSYGKCSQERAERIYLDILDTAFRLLGGETPREELDEIATRLVQFS